MCLGQDVARARRCYEETLSRAVGTAVNPMDMHWIEYLPPGRSCLALTNAFDLKTGAGGGTTAFEVEGIPVLMGDVRRRLSTFTSEVIRVLRPNIIAPLCNLELAQFLSYPFQILGR